MRTTQLDFSSNRSLHATQTPGGNNVTLKGRLVPHNDTTELASVSSLFTNYLNGESSAVVAKGVSALQPSGDEISWLSAGISALSLNVPFINPSNGPIGPIKAITIEDMDLTFSEENPWAPVANTHHVFAQMQLPFGFGLSIGQIMNGFNISQNDTTIAGLQTVRTVSLISWRDGCLILHSHFSPSAARHPTSM